MFHILSLDTETTGVNPKTARVVTCSLQFLTISPELDDVFVDRQISYLVDCGEEIPADAARVHGWTTKRVRAHPKAMSSPKFLARLKKDLKAWKDMPMVVFNAPYDLTIIREELARCGDDKVPSGLVIDPLIIDRHLDPRRKGTLSERCAYYGITLDNAHDAGADALAAALLVPKLLRRLPEALRGDMTALHEAQKGWYATWRNGINDYWERIGSPSRAAPGWPLQEGA